MDTPLKPFALLGKPTNHIDDVEIDEESEEVDSEAPESSQKRVRRQFSASERLHVFQYILSECKSRVPGREGRIAKFKVQTNSSKVWEKFKQLYGYERDVAVYRLHYNFNSPRLHTVIGLSPDERVDLYYAMDIPVTCEKERTMIIEKYGCTLNSDNIVTGSTKCEHWDLVHSDSEDDKDGDEGRETTRYVEYQDGVMWQFLLDRAMSTTDIISYGLPVWKEFREIYNSPIIRKKSYVCYADRCRRILLPNLHIMPFDIETKAALYQSLDYPVPPEFKEILITETGVEILSNNFIAEYPARPAHLVLQSRPFDDSPIGITSTTKFSTLRAPEEHRSRLWIVDQKGWSDKENQSIWEYILKKATETKNGVMRPIEVPKYGSARFWWKFTEAVKTNRSCHALAQHFKLLRTQILSSGLDLESNINLYYIITQPVDRIALERFKSISILVLDAQRLIRYAVGKTFLIGPLAGESFENFNTDNYSFHYDPTVLKNILGLEGDEKPDYSKVPQQLQTYMLEFERKQHFAYLNLSNSLKFSNLDGPFYRGASKRKSMTPEDLCDQPRGKEMKVEIVKDEMPSMEKEVVKLEPVEQESDRPPHLFPMISNNGVNPQEIPYLPLESAFEELEKRIRIFTEKLQEGCRMMKESQRIAYVNELENSKMWAPIVENLWNYGYQENAHYHQHHYPSAHHTERFQTLSCPSDVPIDTSYCNNMSPTYQDLGHDLSPQFWCAEVDCAYERCATRVIPRGQSIYFRHDEGIHEASPVNDNLKNNDWEVKKAFRKEQSKVASARYRVKKKAKRQELLDQLEAEEKRNARLKRKFAQLEKDVAEARFHLKLSHK